MNKSSEERTAGRRVMEVSEENMRREKLFRRWRTENGEHEQSPKGRQAL